MLDFCPSSACLGSMNSMITAPQSVLLKGLLLKCQLPASFVKRRFRNACGFSSSNKWILGRWPKDDAQRLFRWWLKSSKSSFPWRRLGPSICHPPKNVSHLESSNVLGCIFIYIDIFIYIHPSLSYPSLTNPSRRCSRWSVPSRFTWHWRCCSEDLPT